MAADRQVLCSRKVKAKGWSSWQDESWLLHWVHVAKGSDVQCVAGGDQEMDVSRLTVAKGYEDV